VYFQLHKNILIEIQDNSYSVIVIGTNNSHALFCIVVLIVYTHYNLHSCLFLDYGIISADNDDGANSDVSFLYVLFSHNSVMTVISYIKLV
jgi:hypothetical protein